MMMPCIRTLTAAERPKYQDHLLRLDADARRLRFGFIAVDDAIRKHMRQLDSRKDRIIVHMDDDLRIVGAAHIASAQGDAVEFAFSVDAEWRGRGLGHQLLDQSVLLSRNRGKRHAFIYFLVDNRAMRHLARRTGMTIRTEAGECEGHLQLEPPTPLSYLRELATERWGMYDRSVKAGRRRRRPLSPQPAF